MKKKNLLVKRSEESFHRQAFKILQRGLTMSGVRIVFQETSEIDHALMMIGRLYADHIVKDEF